MKKLIVLLCVSACLQGCFTYYPKYPKPIKYCDEFRSPKDTIEQLLLNEWGVNPDYVKITDTSVIFKKRQTYFAQVKYIRMRARKQFIGKKYYIEIIKNDKKREMFYSKDKQTAINAMCAFQCLSAIDLDTNKKILTPQEDKYDKLKKLDQLFKSNAISQDEYNKEKARLLE